MHARAVFSDSGVRFSNGALLSNRSSQSSVLSSTCDSWSAVHVQGVQPPLKSICCIMSAPRHVPRPPSSSLTAALLSSSHDGHEARIDMPHTHGSAQSLGLGSSYGGEALSGGHTPEQNSFLVGSPWCVCVAHH